MKDTDSKVQLLGVLLVGVVAILVAFRMTVAQQRGLKSEPKVAREFQVDVLSQVAATPGKTIQANDRSTGVTSYACKPEDAAVLVFTARDKQSGASVPIRIESATDANGNDYLFSQSWWGPIYLIAVQRGFKVSPKVIRFRIAATDASYRSSHPTIDVTAIAPPHRDLPPPSGAEAASAEKIVRAEIDSRRGWGTVRCVERLPPLQSEFAIVVRTSFGCPWAAFPRIYREAIDAVKVEVQRMQESGAETTLTYRNAKVVTIKGKPFLSLPTDEVIGTICGHPITLGNKIPHPTEGTSVKADGRTRSFACVGTTN